MTAMCPACGYNLVKDEPIQLDGYTLGPHLCIAPGGVNVHLTPGEAGVLYALAKAGGGWVSTEALHNRVSDAEDARVVPVYVFRIRKKLGKACPIEGRNTRGHGGYRWRVP